MERAACGLHPVRSVREGLHELQPLPGWGIAAGLAGACGPVVPVVPGQSIATAVRGHFDESEGAQECPSEEGGVAGEAWSEPPDVWLDGLGADLFFHGTSGSDAGVTRAWAASVVFHGTRARGRGPLCTSATVLPLLYTVV